MIRAYHLTRRSMVSQTSDGAAETANELIKYELMVILTSDMSQEETEKQLDVIRGQIKELNGEIYHEDLWGVRDLAYIIKKHDRGYYAIFYFTFEGKNLAEMESNFRLDAKIIRHMIVKSPKNYSIKPLSELELTEEDIAKKRTRPAKPAKFGAAKSTVIAEKVEKKEAKAEVKKETAPVTEKAEEKAEEKVEKAVEAPKKEDKKPMDISDLDSQLESILDDPDINIKL
jgi:small subunit ribosomal protein S6